MDGITPNTPALAPIAQPDEPEELPYTVRQCRGHWHVECCGFDITTDEGNALDEATARRMCDKMNIESLCLQTTTLRGVLAQAEADLAAEYDVRKRVLFELEGQGTPVSTFPERGFGVIDLSRAVYQRAKEAEGVLAQIAALPRFDLRYEERAGQPSVKQLPHVDGGYTDAAALHALLDAGVEQ